MNQEQLEKLVKSILIEIGEDPSREGLAETPARVAKSYKKLFEGYRQNPMDLITVFDNEGYDEMVIAGGIEFYSFCEHHMLPFFGKVHIGYIPDDKIIGLSKMPRLVDIFAKRLQNQERLTKQIADTLTDMLQPKGVGVVVEARHMCMQARGVQKQHSKITTSSFTGGFKTNMATRNEFLDLIK